MSSECLKPRLIPVAKDGDADKYDLFMPVPNGMWRVVRLMVSHCQGLVGAGAANEMEWLVSKTLREHARLVASGGWAQ